MNRLARAALPILLGLAGCAGPTDPATALIGRTVAEIDAAYGAPLLAVELPDGGARRVYRRERPPPVPPAAPVTAVRGRQAVTVLPPPPSPPPAGEYCDLEIAAGPDGRVRAARQAGTLCPRLEPLPGGAPRTHHGAEETAA